MPVRNVLVCDTGCYIKHDDTTLAVDIVSISQAPEFLLTRSIPHVELNLSQVLFRVSGSPTNGQAHSLRAVY